MRGERGPVCGTAATPRDRTAAVRGRCVHRPLRERRWPLPARQVPVRRSLVWRSGGARDRWHPCSCGPRLLVGEQTASSQRVTCPEEGPRGAGSGGRHLTSPGAGTSSASVPRSHVLFTVTLRRLRFSGEAAGTQGDEVRAGEQVWLDRTRPAILHPGHVLCFQKAQDGPGRPGAAVGAPSAPSLQRALGWRERTGCRGRRSPGAARKSRTGSHGPQHGVQNL